MTDLFAYTEAREAREAKEAALALVAENGPGFIREALLRIAELPPGDYTGERVRELLVERGIMPHHHNAWGALTSTAVKRGLLVPSGRWTPMKGKKSHGRQTPVYVRPGR